MKDLEPMVRTWLPVVVLVVQGLTTWILMKVYKLFATKEQVNAQAEKIEKHDVKIGDVEGKVQLIEQEIKNLPTSKDLCELKESIAAMNATNKILSRGMKRIEDFLIQKGQ